ncbi:MAG: hypothetical protein ACRDJC_24860 [Thermomicrobiales bacterium]
MNNRRDAGVFSTMRTGVGRRVRGILMVTVPALGLAVALVGFAPAAPASAQDNSGGSINIGGSIADTVAGAVSSISTGSGGGSVSGGVSVEHNEASFGEDEGTAIADASGGNHNASATNR